MKSKILTLLSIVITSLSFGQYEQYENLVMPYLSDSIRSGFFYFNTPNNFQPGQLYQMYRTGAPDSDNDMLLLETHTDSLVGLTHYKYQQTYKDVPVEGAGCIEHYQNNMLLFINAKIADSINKSPIPEIDSITAVKKLIDNLKKRDGNIKFAWEIEDLEHQIQKDLNDSTATYYPTAKLIWAIDTMKDVQLIIPGERFSLAYKISITTVNPHSDVIEYFVDANSGIILKYHSSHINTTYANVYGYGSRILDMEWIGGFVHKYQLNATDPTHNIHTKKYTNETDAWDDMSETRLNSTNWGNTYLTETSTHFHVTNTWDYFKNTFSRIGMDGQGGQVRVRTQWNNNNAYYNPNVNPSVLTFGKTPQAWDLGMESSIVGHEFTHGITHHTANLGYEYESGALNESFSDIFGVVIQAQTLDGGSTDWIQGNLIPNDTKDTRSFKDPNTRGVHWSGQYDVNNNPIYYLGQPDSYNGTYWCNCPNNVDVGGVHINSGVQNKWFQILTDGGQNIQGIGMNKAARIAYYALTSILLSSSQYTDSKEATITAAKILFGECSVEHISTVKAWLSVGVWANYNCQPMSIKQFVANNDVLIYPNPVSSMLTIELPEETNTPVQIFDMSGKFVREFKILGIYTQTDISNLQNGVYFVNFDFNGQKVVKRLIVQK